MSKGKTRQSVTLPEYQEQQQKELFQAAKGVAGQPFVPYTGPRIAGFSPDQLRQFEATRGLFETGMEYDPLTGIRELAQAPTPSLLGADIGAYQSPFQRQVTDIALGDIRREAELARQAAQERAIGAGAFGGSRSAILEAEATRPYAEQAAKTAATLGQAGFEQAQRAAEADIQRQMMGREFRAGLLGGLQQEQMRRLGALGDIGRQQQLLQQQALQIPYQEFQRALAYGPQQLGLLATGMGVTTPQTTTSTRGSSIAELGQGLGGLGALIGAFSDKKLKKNIKFIGKSKEGFNLYKWDWNSIAKKLGVNSPTIGVIAQEVQKTHPQAVSKSKDGYLMVNYMELANG